LLKKLEKVVNESDTTDSSIKARAREMKKLIENIDNVEEGLIILKDDTFKIKKLEKILYELYRYFNE